MSLHTIPRSIPKLRSYAPSANLFRTSPPQKTVQKRTDPFASALAHEVRNPLTNINLAVEMLKSTNRDVQQEIFLDIILRNSGRIDSLVNELLVSYQTDEIRTKKYSIHQLLEEVIAQSEDRILLKNITVRRDYSGPDFKILVNKQRIKIAFTNIIINAIDAMPPENGKLKLVIKSMNGKCILEIEDNGTGISKENLAHIFEPLFTNKPGGLGLGLSTTLNILQSNRVKTDVQSEKGKGTRFILTFDHVSQSGEPVHNSSYNRPFTMTA
jgi:signal transduction histidine kinase